MNKLTRNDYTEVGNDSTAQVTIRVGMHDLRASRNDVRAMRAATTLVEAGLAISIVDVESEVARCIDEDIHGIHIHHIMVPDSFGSTRFENWAFIKAIQLFFRSTLCLIQTSADIYHACEVTALPACYIAAILRRKPLIFEAYELPLFDRPLSEMSKTRRWLRRLLGIFLAYVVPRCAAVITVSPPIVQEIRNRYSPSRVALVRNLPAYRFVAKSDRLRQRLSLDPDVRIALYQGFLQPDRGLDRLVRAAKFLDKDVMIVMMGQGVGTTQAELESLIVSEGVADRVRILPPVPYEELLDWTASADIGLTIIPLDYTLNMRMCLPNKLFEYLMAGLPVLSSPLEAVTEIINKYDVGRVVHSLEPAVVGTAINAMIKDDVALSRMRNNALEASQQSLSWEKESLELLVVYKNVLVSRGKGRAKRLSLNSRS